VGQNTPSVQKELQAMENASIIVTTAFPSVSVINAWGIWSPRSIDLGPPDYHFMGIFEETLHIQITLIQEKMQVNVWHTDEGISNGTLKKW